MSLKIIPATESDIPRIGNLATKIWNEYYLIIISQEQINYMLARFYSPDATRQQMNDGHRFHMIYDEKNVIGYLSESNTSECDYFLHKFYLLDPTRGKGIGQEVFHTIFSTKPNLDTIRLTVNRKNFRSINFYFKLGFIIERVEDFNIENGFLMEDFVMLYRAGTKFRKD